MMAGQIAEKFNNENGKFGVEAKAYNNLELFGISNGRLQFDLYGDNSTATSIDVTVVNNDTTALSAAINSKIAETGVSASVSGSGAILLRKLDGNDISLKNFSIATGTVSARQIDKFGEKFNLHQSLLQLESMSFLEVKLSLGAQTRSV